MAAHPYKGIRPEAHWIKGVVAVEASKLDPVGDFKFKVPKTARLGTGGSCFAQHVTRHLNEIGLAPYITEAPHPLLTDVIPTLFNYGVYTARFGNIYTSRQLVQLFDRAYGTFVPKEPIWRNDSGGFVDPFRPTIEPGGGFASAEELLADRAQHFRAVRQMFENLDFFIFTLGLTEHWYSREDGAVFPVCPGVSGGSFDPQRYAFANLDVNEVVADLEAIVGRLAQVNAAARIILTVSPVPLMATAEARHVVVSTMASKSILRAACDMMDRRYAHVAYFPSYEIIAGHASRGRYYAHDLRSVDEEGVKHVMRLFIQHVVEDGGPSEALQPDVKVAESEHFVEQMQNVVQAICDEDALR
jgi:hypothetical protein